MRDDSESFLLPPDVRDLVEADRGAPDPPLAIKRELARRLERRIGLAAFALGMTEAKTAAASLAPSASSAAKIAAASAAWKWAAVASMGVALAGGLVPLAAPRIESTLNAGKAHIGSARSFEQVSRNTLLTSSAADSGQTEERAVDDSKRHQRTAPGRVAAAAPTAPIVQVDRLGEERALLDGARRALVQHDAPGAMQTIQLHERLFQRGELVQERESLRIKALVALGDFAGARSAGERFRRKYAHSVLLPVIENTLEAIP